MSRCTRCTRISHVINNPGNCSSKVTQHRIILEISNASPSVGYNMGRWYRQRKPPQADHSSKTYSTGRQAQQVVKNPPASVQARINENRALLTERLPLLSEYAQWSVCD